MPKLQTMFSDYLFNLSSITVLLIDKISQPSPYHPAYHIYTRTSVHPYKRMSIILVSFSAQVSSSVNATATKLLFDPIPRPECAKGNSGKKKKSLLTGRNLWQNQTQGG